MEHGPDVAAADDHPRRPPAAEAAAASAAAIPDGARQAAARPGFDPADPATWGNPSRNDPCPCGSGLKFKHCHGAL